MILLPPHLQPGAIETPGFWSEASARPSAPRRFQGAEAALLSEGVGAGASGWEASRAAHRAAFRGRLLGRASRRVGSRNDGCQAGSIIPKAAL